MKYESPSRKIFNVCNIAFMSVLAIIMLYPMWYVFCAAFSEADLLMQNESILWKPLGFTTAAFKAMLKNPMIVRGFINAVIIMVSGTALNLLFTSMCAYVLTRKNVLWNKFFSKYIIFTMYFGGGLIPTYLLVAGTLHLNNSWWALILPGLISVYNMFILRTAFSSIPDSLVESATLDGASHWTILFRIIMPLSKASLAVIVLYCAVGHWNSWFNASIYLKDREKFPIQLILREILIANDTGTMTGGTGLEDQVQIAETIKYATVLATTLPILIVYPFLQKYFVQGVMIGAVKG